MSKYKYTEFERQINSVLSHQSAELSEIHFPSTDRIDACISSSEEFSSASSAVMIFVILAG